MNIYTREGWLNAPHIEEVADRNNISFIVIIGGRQIGKTYNVLRLMLDSQKTFILLRGMRTELEVLQKNVNSPFEVYDDYAGRIYFDKESEYTAGIYLLDQDEEGNETKKRIGMGAALSNIARIRGFNGSAYSDIVFDEFIPESHLLKVRNGDDAFNNMYTTVAGNRELKGQKPLRVWLLANSNNLDSDILKALNITDVVEKMAIRGEESRILKDRGIMILLPDSTQIMAKRKNTALYRAIGGDSKFSRMAYGNEFAYNDYTDVKTRPIKEYRPLIHMGEVTIMLHKDNNTLYITELQRCKCRHVYTDTDYGRNKLARDYPELKAAFMKGRIVFQSMKVKNYFLDFIDLL